MIGIAGRGKSTYGGDRIWWSLEWWLSRGYMAPTYEEANALPALPFEVWDPAKTGDAFTEDSGQGLLIPPSASHRERVKYASEYVHLMSMTDQWLSPPTVIDPARRALGGTITTDPASCAEANSWINAEIWYSVDHSGLHRDHPWRGTAWINPPYGRGESSAGAFVDRLVAEMKARNVTAAITCLNLNSASSQWFDPVWEHAAVHLIWRGRINFIKPAGDADSSPSKGTILSYFGPDPSAFSREFERYGTLLYRPGRSLDAGPVRALRLAGVPGPVLGEGLGGDRCS
jgi:DNA N-6-adenine-methyltransferase (Dam)